MTGASPSSEARVSPARGWLVIAGITIVVQVGFAFATNVSRFRDASTRLGDVDIYEKYADLMTLGGIPYRDFVVEYPPASLPLFLVPKLLSRDLSGFRHGFAIEMLAFHAATLLLVSRWIARCEGTRRLVFVLIWYSLSFFLIARLVVSRYDAAPAFLALAASYACASGRGGTAGFLAAFGTMVKIFPALTMPFAPARASRRQAWTLFVVTSLLGIVLWVALGGWSGLFASLSYHSHRDLEYGSVYSGLQMLAAKAAGAEIVVHRDHASFSTTTPASFLLKAIAVPVQIATILAVMATLRIRRRIDPMRYTAAAITAFAVLGKVFSPQYTIWILPFLAVLEGPIAVRARRMFLLAVALTLAAQGLIGPLERTSLAVIASYNAKNLAWISLLVVLAFSPNGQDEVASR